MEDKEIKVQKSKRTGDSAHKNFTFGAHFFMVFLIVLLPFVFLSDSGVQLAELIPFLAGFMLIWSIYLLITYSWRSEQKAGLGVSVAASGWIVLGGLIELAIRWLNLSNPNDSFGFEAIPSLFAMFVVLCLFGIVGLCLSIASGVLLLPKIKSESVAQK